MKFLCVVLLMMLQANCVLASDVWHRNVSVDEAWHNKAKGLVSFKVQDATNPSTYINPKDCPSPNSYQISVEGDKGQLLQVILKALNEGEKVDLMIDVNNCSATGQPLVSTISFSQ